MTLRAKSKIRKYDCLMANEVSKFLDETFYPQETTNFERVVDTKRQIEGIDTIFEYNGEKYLCDEKAAVHYRGLKTYTLELSFINKWNQVQDGWLVSDKEKNNSFLLIWVENDCVEVALVKKSVILDYLKSLGWTVQKLKEKDKKIRNNLDEPLGTIEENKCRFIISKRLVEQPVNIQLPKDKYIEIAHFHGIYKTDKFAQD